MNLLDRAGQRHLLEGLREKYPSHVPLDVLSGPELSRGRVRTTIYYLSEHGLTEPSNKDWSGVGAAGIQAARLTAKGADFLADDGGLGAILNTVTVRLEREQFVQLVEAALTRSGATEQQRSTILEAVKKMGTKAVERLVATSIEALATDPAKLESLLSALPG